MAVIGSVVQRLERGSYKAQKKVRLLPDPLIYKVDVLGSNPSRRTKHRVK